MLNTCRLFQPCVIRAHVFNVDLIPFFCFFCCSLSKCSRHLFRGGRPVGGREQVHSQDRDYSLSFVSAAGLAFYRAYRAQVCGDLPVRVAAALHDQTAFVRLHDGQARLESQGYGPRHDYPR